MTEKKTTALALFEQQGWLDEQGKFNDGGKQALAELLGNLSTIWGGDKWGPVFTPLMSKVVPFSTEMVVVRNDAALLTWREFEGTAGWHTPGSYVNPREDWQSTVSRIAGRELKCNVTFDETLHTFNNYENPRFHDLTVLARCELTSEPQVPMYDPGAGAPKPGEFAWFNKKPTDILPVHDKYWAPIEAALG
jgi:ADP-ribose pyrophosphatase YjhB (NUDIX family)